MPKHNQARLGRAAGFVVVDLESMDIHYIDDGQSQVMAQGADILATELLEPRQERVAEFHSGV